MESETFSKLTAIQKLIAIYIILNANHEDGTWYDKYNDLEVSVKRGQLIVSRNKIANEWFRNDKDVTEQKIRTTLKRLEKFGFLTIKSTKHYTLLEVHNYNVYQQQENETNQPTNQGLTNAQPRLNQGLTTNKNDKNNKESVVVVNTQAENEIDDVDLIANRFADLKTMQQGRVCYPNTKDYQAITRIVTQGVPTSQTIKLLEQCFEEYETNNPGESIHSFGYCEKYILGEFKKMQQAVRGTSSGTNRTSSPKAPTTSSNRKDSITGGQLGWIGRDNTNTNSNDDGEDVF